MTAQLPRFPGQGEEGWSQWLEAGPAAGTSLYICAQGSLTGGETKGPRGPLMVSYVQTWSECPPLPPSPAQARPEAALGENCWVLEEHLRGNS